MVATLPDRCPETSTTTLPFRHRRLQSPTWRFAGPVYCPRVKGNNGAVAWPSDTSRGTGGPSPGEPDRRALDAIAAAVARAQSATSRNLPPEPAIGPNGVESPTPTEPIGVETPTAPTQTTGVESQTPTEPAPGGTRGPTPPQGTPATPKAQGSADVSDDRSTDLVATVGASIPVFDDFALDDLPLDDLPLDDVPIDDVLLGAVPTEPPGHVLPAPRHGRQPTSGPAPAADRTSRSLPSRHAVVVAVVVVAAAILVVGGLAAGLRLTNSAGSSPPARAGSTHTPSSGGTSPAGRGGGSAGGTSGASATTTKAPTATKGAGRKTPATSPSATAGGSSAGAGTPGAPRLTSIQPASGAAGQTVTVTGSGLYSSSGEITAYVAGSPAPTSCSSQTTCTVTIPDLGPPRRTTLVVETASGSSNAVGFRYT